MSQWRCKLSGTVITVPDYEDVNMEGHDGYELVEVKEVEEQPKKQSKSKKEVSE